MIRIRQRRRNIQRLCERHKKRLAHLARVHAVPHTGNAFFELVLRLAELGEGAGEVLEFVVELLLDRREVLDGEGVEVN